MRLRLALILLTAGALSCGAQDTTSLERFYYPLSPAPAAVPKIAVEYDTDPTPQTKAWGEAAAKVMEQWWPAVCRMLATEQLRAPDSLLLRFQKDQKIPGYRTAEGLFVSTDWVTKNPDDIGMIIHEMTHAIQDYRGVRPNDGWLVEGIADYIRYWRFEPEKPKRTISREKSSYRDGYNSTPSFLAWLLWKYDRRIVHQLDAALRAGTYKDDLFQKLTGKPVEDLWQEFLGALPWAGVSVN